MVTGQILRDSFISGANNITKYRKQVDALNVFPVPDGDTGSNMSMTIGEGSKALAKLEDSCTVGEVAETAASALLRGARGNSGVILSLLFRGFAKELKGKVTASAADMTGALAAGVKSAYEAVLKPVEGTILTVARESGEKAQSCWQSCKNVGELWEAVYRQAAETLAKTPDLLPVLKSAGVVDAGGKGLVYIFEGMLSVLKNGAMVPASEDVAEQDEFSQKLAEIDDSNITFTYCTEFIVQTAKPTDPTPLRQYLETIGDSIVVVGDDDIIKIHVHTDNPGNALQQGLLYGSLTKLKIENMREQHDKIVAAKANDLPYAAVDPEREYGFVAVADGSGLTALFEQLGVDRVVLGGQTMNPSTDNLLKAIHAVPAKTVYVLPNNKNIIMAATQAVELADREVRVVPTRSIPQGISAMLSFSPDSSVEENFTGMSDAAEKTKTGQLTFAARDAEFDGHKILEGQILALENGKLRFIGNDIDRSTVRLARTMVEEATSFVTIYFGENTTEKRAKKIADEIGKKVSADIEVSIVEGGQQVYPYLISVE